MNRIEKMKKFYRENEDSLYLIALGAVSVVGSMVALTALNKDAKIIADLVKAVQDKDIAAVNTRTNDDGVFQVKVTHKNGSYSVWDKKPEEK
jgi:hypothetical protein